MSIETLQEALSIKEEIATLETRLTNLLAGGEVMVPSSILPKIKKARRKMSAAGRAKIAAARRARWAKAKGI